VALVGLVVPQLRVLYDYAWFVGFGVSFVVHCSLSLGPRIRAERAASVRS
jgi:nucleobase:cation symporter-1, NCS1 family